jgi:16S rRNA (cytosine967-C5)-methyltransferase
MALNRQVRRSALHRAKPVHRIIPGLPTRQAAARFYKSVIYDKASLDDLFDPDFGDPLYINLIPKDRSLLRAITMTALRRRQTLMNVLNTLLDKPLKAHSEDLEAVLMIGAAQILLMNVSDHAAVDLSVETAGQTRTTKPYKGLVNAVLRRMVREKDDLLETMEDISELPEWLLERWTHNYGEDETKAMATLLKEEPYLDLHLKNPCPDFAKEVEGQMLPNGMIRLGRNVAVRTLPGFDEGHWWVQDFAASLPVTLLGTVKDLRIADLCAAPGGKTAQLVKAGARVYAFDISADRMERVKVNMNRLGYRVDMRVMDIRDNWMDEPFDKILLDAPCSSTGTLRRNPDVAYRRNEKDIASLARLQSELLAATAPKLKKGGQLVYSVCSLEPEEGEKQIAAFLDDHPDFALDPVGPEGIFGLSQCLRPDGTVRSLPFHMMHDEPRFAGMDGFFAARLLKTG